MPGSAGSLILEVKRRLGDVNMPVPDETDVLAYLNSALRGIWNYGIELGSPRLEAVEYVTAAADGTAALSKAPVKVTRVVDLDKRRDLPRYTPRAAAGRALTESYQGMWGFCEAPSGVRVFMSADCGGGCLSVAYFPEFAPLASREDLLPFGSSLDDVVAAWAVKLIVNGTKMSYADMANVLGAPINSLVQYFEGQAEECFVGRGPW